MKTVNVFRTMPLWLSELTFEQISTITKQVQFWWMSSMGSSSTLFIIDIKSRKSHPRKSALE
ncbi:MAG: hypothetical protein MUC59_03115, partial [Saprospiraceae bacterium]|nr:hypothetical protein [Saprospiraceae bacterium]